MATILDVIDNFWGNDPLGSIAQADSKMLFEFGRHVRQFYESYEIPAAETGELRTYHGDLAAVHFALSGAHLEGLSLSFATNLLYAHKTVVPDPIALWYFEDFEKICAPPPTTYFNRVLADQSEIVIWALESYRALQFDERVSREALSYLVNSVLSIRELIEENIVILISQAHELLKVSGEVLKTALRDASSDSFLAECDGFAQLPMWDTLRGRPFTADIGLGPPDPAVLRWAGAKECSYHLNKHFFIAEMADAVFIPTDDADSDLLAESLRLSAKSLGGSSLQKSTASTILKAFVPSFGKASAADVISIRKNEAAFEEFRVILQRRFLSPENLQDSVREQASIELEMEIETIRKKISSKAVLKSFIFDQGLEILGKSIIGATAGAFAGHALLGATLPVAHQLHKKFKSAGTGYNASMIQIARFKNLNGPQTPAGDYASKLPKAFRHKPMGRLALGPDVSELAPRDFSPTALWNHASKILYA